MKPDYKTKQHVKTALTYIQKHFPKPTLQSLNNSTNMSPKLKDFKAWLSIQPSDRQFNYFDQLDCPFASFMREYHHIPVCVGGFTYLTQDSAEYKDRKNDQGLMDFYETESEGQHKLPQWFIKILSNCNKVSSMSAKELLAAYELC